MILFEFKFIFSPFEYFIISTKQIGSQSVIYTVESFLLSIVFPNNIFLNTSLIPANNKRFISKSRCIDPFDTHIVTSLTVNSLNNDNKLLPIVDEWSI